MRRFPECTVDTAPPAIQKGMKVSLVMCSMVLHSLKLKGLRPHDYDRAGGSGGGSCRSAT
jgi:hypothetical protein